MIHFSHWLFTFRTGYSLLALAIHFSHQLFTLCIVVLFIESIEELKELIENRRVRMLNKQLLESGDDSSEEIVPALPLKLDYRKSKDLKKIVSTTQYFSHVTFDYLISSLSLLYSINITRVYMVIHADLPL